MSFDLNYDLIKNFFRDIYKSILNRLEDQSKFDSYVFTEIMDRSMFCCEKIFSVINISNSNKKYLCEKDFSEGLLILYFGNNYQIVDILFSILDFDNDKIINYDDTKLFFIHLYSSSPYKNTEKNLYEIIDNFYHEKKEYSFNDFKQKCLIDDSTLISLFKFLIHSKKFFNFKQLKFYFEIQNPNKKFLYSDFLLYENDFNIETISQNKSESSNLEIDIEESENDLNELINFEVDLQSTMEEIDNRKISYSKHHKEQKENKKKEKQFNQILKSFFKSRSNNFEKKKSTKKLQKKNNSVCQNEQNQNIIEEIILFQLVNNNLKQVKIIIINNIMFCYKVYNNISYFDKIIFLSNTYLFIKGSKKISNKIYFVINLISYTHENKYNIEFLTEIVYMIKKFQKIFSKENPSPNFLDDYEMEKEEIGKGKYGICKKCIKKNNDNINKDINIMYCVKILKKYNKNSKNVYRIILTEKSIFTFLKKFPHENIIKCIDYYEDYENVYFVFEYIPFDLKKIYISTTTKNEKIDKSIKILKICNDVLKGLNHLHSYGIIHRDIKHTNILITKDNIAKIIDFGFSKVYSKNELITFKCGSLVFEAPEIILGQVNNNKVDIWATGITLYYLLYAITPFYDKNTNIVKEKICKNSPNFPQSDYYNKNNPYSTLNLIIKECLNKNSNKRPSASELIQTFFSSK